MKRKLPSPGLVFAAFAIFVLGGISGALWDRIYVFWSGPKTYARYNDLDAEVNSFNRFVDLWNGYVRSHDGVIPTDPYRGLIDSGTVETYAQLRGIVFEGSIPPRINPDLRQNAKRTVFFQTRDELEEVWMAFADGTWSRVSFRNVAKQDSDWQGALAHAGYPEWKSAREKDAWIAANRDKLVWDAQKKIYVVAPKR